MTADTDLAQVPDPAWQEPDPDPVALRVLEVLAELRVAVSGLTEQMQRKDDLLYQIAQDIYPLAVPAVQGIVTAGGGLTIASEPLLGPRAGYHWDIRRISLTGLASAAEQVILWKVGVATTVSAQPQNFVTTFIGPTDYLNTGLGVLWLRAGETLMVTGSGLTPGEPVTLSADGFCIASRWVGLYLL